jgi:hypothetical protein
MLIARLDRVTQEIAQLRELRQQANNAQAFGTRAKQWNDLSVPLDSLATIAQEFQRRGITIPLDRSQLAMFAKEVRAVATAYHEDPQSILTAPEHRFTFWEPLRTLPDRARTALLQAWSEYINATLPIQQQPELLQTLGQLPGFRVRVEQISQLYRETERLRGRLPQSADEIDRIATIASELKTTWAQLPAEGIPADVRDFLTTAVEGNARLAQLTGPVMEWLQINNLADSVRISLKA